MRTLSRHPLRRVASPVLALGILLLPPLAFAQSNGASATPGDDRLAVAQRSAARLLGELRARLADKQAGARQKDELRELRRSLDAVDAEELSDFAKVERHLRATGAARLMLERHAEALRSYRSGMAALKSSLDAAQKARSGPGGARDASRLQQLLPSQRGGARRRFDPGRLPMRRLEPNRANKPRLAAAEFARADLESNPRVRIASAAPLALVDLPGADDPAFLAETTEVVLGAAVQDRANALGHQPVAIFNWVHDNLEWSPGWGAIQRADHTLGSGRGNAIDLASALIALLRVSGIPARYVHGTVEMDADRFRVLAGDFGDAGAAVDFASAAGLPIVAVVSGGRIARIRFEHVWVEAAVDFFPSRGALNRVVDHWVSLDPSIKRVESLATPDYLALSGVPVASVVQAWASSGTSDPVAGWVQGLDSAALEQGLTPSPDAQAEVAAAVRSFFQDSYRPDDTVSLAEIAGGLRTTPRTDDVLPTGLPYGVLLVGARYAQLPPALQAQATIWLGAGVDGTPLSPVTLPLSQVNNQPLSVTFTFASLADHDAYASFLPDGPVTELSQLPDSVPAYLVSVVPQLRLRDDVIASAPPLRLGEPVSVGVSLSLPGVVGGRDRVSSVIAGSQLGLVICAGSVSPEAFERLRVRYAEAGALLDTGSIDDMLAYAGNLTLRLAGDAFHAGALEYFAQRLTVARLVTSGARLGRFQLVAGVASFGYVPTVSFRFGVPRSLGLGGLQLDAPNLLVNVQSRDGDPELRRQLLLRVGLLGSSLEADVPAFLRSPDLATPDDGRSAANNLLLALEAGQRIYDITERNRASIADLQLPAEVLADITAAVDAGLEVITHQLPLAAPGRVAGVSTAGYVVLDPVTGEGQYLLDNGTNGGLSNTADQMLEHCAYMNRPGFVDNDVDWARFKITRKCAELARDLKQKAIQADAKLMQDKIKAVQDFHEVFAKVPLVIADCITAGAPLILSDALVLIRSAAIQMAFITADLRSALIVEQQKKLAEDMKKFVELVHDFCMEFPP